MSEQGKDQAIGKLILAKNRQWTCALEKGLAKLPEDLQREVMQGPGADCAHVIMHLCGKNLGHAPEGIEDLLEGYNLLRESLGLHGKWQLKDGVAIGVFSECGCPLIRTGLLELHPTRCLCTHAMLEALFQEATGGPVKVEIVESIARGDQVCCFQVTPESVSSEA